MTPGWIFDMALDTESDIISASTNVTKIKFDLTPVFILLYFDIADPPAIGRAQAEGYPFQPGMFTSNGNRPPCKSLCRLQLQKALRFISVDLYSVRATAFLFMKTPYKSLMACIGLYTPGKSSTL